MMFLNQNRLEKKTHTHIHMFISKFFPITWGLECFCIDIMFTSWTLSSKNKRSRLFLCMIDKRSMSNTVVWCVFDISNCYKPKYLLIFIKWQCFWWRQHRAKEIRYFSKTPYCNHGQNMSHWRSKNKKNMLIKSKWLDLQI